MKRLLPLLLLSTTLTAVSFADVEPIHLPPTRPATADPAPTAATDQPASPSTSAAKAPATAGAVKKSTKHRARSHHEKTEKKAPAKKQEPST